MPQLGPYSRLNVLAKLDGRTREARMMRQFRIELTEHLGGKPSFTQAALIDRAAWLFLHVAQLDARAVNGRELTEHDARTYLGWSNTLNRCLRQLGLKATREELPSLSSYMSGRAA